MAQTLGSIGEELNLEIRQGATFGPHKFTMTNADGSPVDLTGATITATMKKTPSSPPDSAVPFTIDVSDAAGGEFYLSLPSSATSSLAAGVSLTSPESRYVWDMEYTDSTGKVIPLYYGVASVFRNV